MFARRIGIFSRCSNTSIPRKHLSLVHTRHSPLHVKTIVDIGVGTSKMLDNDYTENKYLGIEHYKIKSWKIFKNNLIPNRLHIFVCPASLKKSFITAGHVACFVTNLEGKIIDGSVMSLQNGDFYLDANNKPVRIVSNIRGNRYPDYLKSVKFIEDMETELREHMFNPGSSTFKITHHLFSMPITEVYLDQFLKNIKNTISLYENDLFQLFNAQVDGKLRKALNCCFGFYRAMGVKGKIDDPSPQMVTWSFILFIYKNLYNDESLRDKLLEGSRLKDNSKFKEDDELEWETPRP